MIGFVNEITTEEDIECGWLAKVTCP